MIWDQFFNGQNWICEKCWIYAKNIEWVQKILNFMLAKMLNIGMMIL